MVDGRRRLHTLRWFECRVVRLRRSSAAYWSIHDKSFLLCVCKVAAAAAAWEHYHMPGLCGLMRLATESCGRTIH